MNNNTKNIYVVYSTFKDKQKRKQKKTLFTQKPHSRIFKKKSNQNI